jgi:hypothetical protein
VPEHNASQRAGQRKLREQMRGLGMSRAEITAEMARRYKLRPRAAWRIAWGWTLEEAAERYNALRARDQAQALASLTGSRLSEWENWPFSTRKPAITSLYLLAGIYHCAVLDLTDVHDREKLPAAELLALGKTSTPPHSRHEDTDPRGDPQSPVVPPARAAAPAITSQDATALAGQAHPDTGPDTVVAALSRPPASRTPGGTDAGERRGTDELAMRAADETCHLASHDARTYLLADRISELVTWVEETNVGNGTLDYLDQATRWLAHDCLTTPPIQSHERAAALTERVFRLLQGGRQRIGQTRDLYVIAGKLCAVLSWMSSDLGHLAAAEAHSRNGWILADQADHDGLRALLLCTQSKNAYWGKRYGDAAVHARRGYEYKPPGTARVLLSCQEADALQAMGKVEDAQTALVRAEQAQENISSPGDLGGIFECGTARHANYSIATYLRADAADRALQQVERAETAWRNGEEWAYGTWAQVQIGAAIAYLMNRDLEGAAATLRPVLSQPAERRLATLTTRLHREVTPLLTRPAAARSKAAIMLSDGITEYCLEQSRIRPILEGDGS